MANDQIVDAIKQAALDAAIQHNIASDTPEVRAAYARGVRAMANLVHACIHVAENSANEHKDSVMAEVMFLGYARALKCIVRAADDLIPPGYEP